MYTVPQYCTLDGATQISKELEGVMLGSLEAYDTIYAQTCNSNYKIFLLDPNSGRALVQGGKYLTEPVEATVSGSTFGGCMLKMGWLGIGLRIEININGQRLETSPVQELRVEHDSLEHSAIDSSIIH
jgi:hypothetical protein